MKRIAPYLSDVEATKFWSLVALPDENGCMLWMAGRNDYGYGRFSYRHRQVGAHRVALWITAGPPADASLLATHSCRIRHCVAPLHLTWATHKQNMLDMRDRDKSSARGERAPSAKLTAEQVGEIRNRYATTKVLLRELASEFGVNTGAILMAVRGVTWADAPGVILTGRRRPTHCPQGHEYTPENVNQRGGRRECRACASERSTRNRSRRKSRKCLACGDWLTRITAPGSEAPLYHARCEP